MHNKPPVDLEKIAVAIKGQPGKSATLVAKGRGLLAEQILELAFAHDVKVREDAAITDMLDAYELDSPIPLPALQAVCAILTHVYQATRKDAGGPL